MTIEIHRPELEAMILQRMKSGGFDNVEDVLMQAFEALPLDVVREKKTRDERMGSDLIAAFQASPHREIDIEAPKESNVTTAPSTLTGAVVLAALQASPYPEIDLAPPRVLLTNVRDVVL